MYEIKIHKKAIKNIKRMPLAIQEKLTYLLKDLKDKGAIRAEWPNFSKLGEKKYHCHLSYKWVVCWQWQEGTIIIEVYYAGTRENAPY
jgi:mRNA-degrading endonuclease RelE of RelBE toxin-antitoxin system